MYCFPVISDTCEVLGMFDCDSSQVNCVMHSAVCDGVVDCNNGRDEEGCGHTTPHGTACDIGHIACATGKARCIPEEWKCDGERDCGDGSDEEYAKILSEKQDWNVEIAPAIADIPTNTLQELFIFKNGVKGDGIYGFQDEVFSSTPSQESEYSALSSVIEVTWKVGQKEIVFESAADVIAAEEGGRVEFNETGIVLNTPQIVWPDGQMVVRSDKEISDDMSYGDGQIIEIKSDRKIPQWSYMGQYWQSLLSFIIDSYPYNRIYIRYITYHNTFQYVVLSGQNYPIIQYWAIFVPLLLTFLSSISFAPYCFFYMFIKKCFHPRYCILHSAWTIF